MSDKINAFVAERDAAFEADDLDWAARQLPNASSIRVVEIAFHEARLDCTNVSDGKRLESQKWLSERGLSDSIGRPVVSGAPLERAGEVTATAGAVDRKG